VSCIPSSVLSIKDRETLESKHTKTPNGSHQLIHNTNIEATAVPIILCADRGQARSTRAALHNDGPSFDDQFGALIFSLLFVH